MEKANASPPAREPSQAKTTKPAGPTPKAKPTATQKKAPVKKAAPKTAAAPAVKKVAQRASKKKTTPAGKAQAPVKAAPTKKIATKKAPEMIYEQVLKDLQSTNRPASLSALERHIQAKIDGTSAPVEVKRLIKRLQSASVIRVADGRLSYLAD